MISGLGKNSPVKLQLTRENYEALVVRHGQWLRWVVGDKCPCVLKSGRPDMNCPYCGGDGIRYSFQKTKRITMEQAQNLGDGLVQLACPVGACISVERISGTKEYPIGEILNGNMVMITGTPPPKWDILFVTYVMTEEVRLQAQVQYLGGNAFQVPVDVLFGDVGPTPFDVTQVFSLINQTQDVTYTEVTARQNFLYVDGAPLVIDVADVIVADVACLPPRNFLLVGQAANRIEQQFLDQIGGEAFLTFPPEYKIGEQDVVTAMSGSIVSKQVMTRNGDEYDKIPEWYISEIHKIETLTGELVQGVDYRLQDRNRIAWLTDAVAKGSKFNIQFGYHPSYKVLKDYPNTRSSENKMLPRRCGLKLLTLGGPKNEGV